MANELEALIRQIVSEIEGAKGSTTQYSAPHTPSTTNTVDRVVTIEDYPIAKKHPEWIDLGQGRDLSYITMDNVMARTYHNGRFENFSIHFKSSRSNC